MPRFPTAATMAAIAFAISLLVAVEGASFRVCEDSGQRQVAGPGANQVQLVYNHNRHEYFAAYLLLEGEQSSIMGQRYDERGGTIGSPIPVYTWQEAIDHRKQFPAVAYNENSDVYLVVWEYEFRGSNADWDIMGRVVHANGSVTQQAFFVGFSFGRDDSPHLAFSPKDNSYVLVHEIEDSLSQSRGIVARRFNETHMLGSAVTVNTSHTDREPFVAYHPPSNDFLVVWEWDDDKDNKSVIGAVVVGDNPIKVKSSKPNIVGSTVEIIGGKVTVAHDHDAQLAYSPKDDHFLLVWEVDGDSGEKEVVCSRVNSDATAKTGFKVVGNSAHPYDRRPSVAYSTYTNDFLIAYESGSDPIATQIEGVAFNSQDLSLSAKPFGISQALNREHAPSIAVSTTCGSVFALWASDTSLSSRSARSVSVEMAEVEFAHTQSYHHHDEPSSLSVNVYKPRNKFVSSQQSLNGFDEEAVPHVYVHADMVPVTSSQAETRIKRDPSDMSNLEAIHLCLPGRGSCTAAGTPLPPVSPPSGGGNDDGPSATGIVLGLLGAVIGLATLGAIGFFVWKRWAQIREWVDTRRSRGFEGVWAEENEFSISVDAFTGSGDDAGAEEERS